MNKKIRFSLKIISISFATIIAFVLSSFFIVIPYFEEIMLERKRETIKELTNSAWTIMQELNEQVENKELTLHEAQNEAIELIEKLRYGDEMKDYFWLINLQPKMLMHPYIPSLNGKDLSDYTDANGKKIFMEIVKIVEKNNYGYIDYMWQWKDDSTKIVPKLSYVKKFDEWGWIIGTGIYIEDVRQEINKLEKKLFLISLFITIIIGLGILFLVWQNFKTEKQRKITYNKLIEAKNKYQKLVEATSKGVVMLIDNKIIYSNDYIYKLLGYSKIEFVEKDFFSHFIEKSTIMDKAKNVEAFNFEAKIIKNSNELIPVDLNFSPIEMNNKKGFTIEIDDISSEIKIKHELNKSIEKFRSITNNIDLGIFRVTFDKKNSLIDANKKTFEILGYKPDTKLSDINLLEHYYSNNEQKLIFNQLLKNKKVKNQILQVKKVDNSIFTAQISLFIYEDKENNKNYCDGIMRDISKQYTKERQKEEFFEELQTMNRFYNQPVRTILEKPLICKMHTSIREATIKMTKAGKTAILISAEDAQIIGIVTDSDIRKRVVSLNKKSTLPIFQIMSAPLQTIKEEALISEALLVMKTNNISFLAVVNENHNINNAISIKEIATIQNQLPNLVIKKIRNAQIIEDLKESFQSIPFIIKTFIESGAKTRTTTKLISKFSDEIIIKIINKIINDIGEAPVKFSFIILGSVGREEQTLVTDQDNAIIFEDTENNKKSKEYFLKIGNEICKKLDYVGYNYCEGDIMASNPKWVMSLNDWKNTFRKWIKNSQPQDVLDSNIFFDFRTIYGEIEFGKNLQSFLNQELNTEKIFFYNLAKSITLLKLPVSFFGNIKTLKSDSKHKYFDIKSVLVVVISFVRIYSLKNFINEKNTCKRIDKLFNMGKLTYNEYNNLKSIYDYLMNFRLNHQIKLINKKISPNNNIETTNLSEFEISFLKKIFSQIADYQSKLSFEYKLNYQ